MESLKFFILHGSGLSRLSPAGKFLFGVCAVGSLSAAANTYKYKNLDYDHPYLQRALEASLFSKPVENMVGTNIRCTAIQATRSSDDKFGKVAIRVEGEKGTGTLYISGMRKIESEETDSEEQSWYERWYNTALRTPFVLKEKILSTLNIQSKALQLMEEVNAIEAAKNESKARPSTSYAPVEVDRVSGDVIPLVNLSLTSNPDVQNSPLDRIESYLGFIRPLPTQKVDLTLNPHLANPAACPSSVRPPTNPSTPEWNLDCIIFVSDYPSPATIVDGEEKHISKGLAANKIVYTLFGKIGGSPFAPSLWKNDTVLFKNESRINTMKWLVLGGGTLLGIFSMYTRFQASKLKLRPIQFATKFSLNHPDIHAVFEAAPSLPPLPVYQNIISKPSPIPASSLVRTFRVSPKDLSVSSIQINNMAANRRLNSDVAAASATEVGGVREATVKVAGPDGREGVVTMWLSARNLKVIKANVKMGDRVFELNCGSAALEK